jgi:signal transduction histidine kinase
VGERRGPLIRATDALRAWLGRRTSTQLVAVIAVSAALALTGSLVVTGLAARMDQRQQAALAALDDFVRITQKLGEESTLAAGSLTPADAAYLSAVLAALQSGPGREAVTLEETCRTGRGGAGVRYIQAPVGKPAGLAELATARRTRLSRIGPDIYAVSLPRGTLCPTRAVEAVVVRRPFGALDVSVGRIVDQSGQAWGWAVLAVMATGLVILVSGLAASTWSNRRLVHAIAEVSRALDRAAVGDFSLRAPEVGVAPELSELTVHANRTLDRLEELMSWLRDSADQLAHDFRTPLARASARLEQLAETDDPDRRLRLGRQAAQDLRRLTRQMNEALALREGEAWRFETVRLDGLARAVADLYQPLAEDRGVTLRVEADAPVSVLGVPSLLQRVAANLVDNAVKFSPEGAEVVIRAGADAVEAVLSVSDRGPGLDPRLLTDADLRVATAEADGRESHGLGLSFVRAVLSRHGGRMTIDDAAPGAIVTARFPR